MQKDRGIPKNIKNPNEQSIIKSGMFTS